MVRRLFLLLIGMTIIGLTACGKESLQSTAVVNGVFTPIPNVSENTPTNSFDNDAVEAFSSDQLSLCFSYPKGDTQIKSSETVEIVAPNLPDSSSFGLFWLEKSSAVNLTAEQAADKELTTASGINVGRWSLTIGGEQAVVLDGMPGQDLQRRVFVVHQQILYVLAFMPTRSENKAAGEQMDDLYAAITNSWAWSPCPAKK